MKIINTESTYNFERLMEKSLNFIGFHILKDVTKSILFFFFFHIPLNYERCHKIYSSYFR